MKILLSKLFESAGVRPDAIAGDAEVSSLVADSRKVVGGSLFVCMPSPNSDTNRFIPDAIGAGANAVIAHDFDGFEIARAAGVAAALISNSFTPSLSMLCKAFFENPTSEYRVIGITGTNGKTTTAWILRDALEALDNRPAYLGTLGYRSPSGLKEMANTTPFPVELFEKLIDAKNEGVTDFVMEVSSHALEEKRSDGVEFDVGVFTNLSQDHLDFHGSMEAYELSKKRLFTELPKMSSKQFVGVLNADDPVGERWCADLTIPVLTYGLQCGDLKGTAIDVQVDRLTLELAKNGQRVLMKAHLGGHYNVHNCLCAAATLVALGYSLDAAASALASATPVPGRFEPVPNDAGIGILVDYAHTPDALEKLLDAARELPHGKIITVFGCGGDRDKAKRPLMAHAASTRSDLTVVTSDNPRTEDASLIIKDIEAGVTGESISIEDRGEAVAYAVGKAEPGDIVVIAGKGHENYQIIGRTKYHMDDRELARQGLAQR